MCTLLQQHTRTKQQEDQNKEKEKKKIYSQVKLQRHNLARCRPNKVENNQLEFIAGLVALILDSCLMASIWPSECD